MDLSINNYQDISALDRSYHYCAEVTAKSGSNFYYGMLLTPRSKRQAMFTIYAWMREIDDIADSNANKRQRLKSLIQFFRNTMQVLAEEFSFNGSPLNDKHWPAFRQTVIEHGIPIDYFRDMLYGQLQTIKNNSFKTFLDVYQYCYRVASTVGLICITIWGYQGGAATRKLAEYRGIALQLTNILRDICFDAAEGQVYVPEEFLKSPHITVKEMCASHYAVKTVLDEPVQQLIKKAGYYYKMSDPLENYVERDGLTCLMVMTEIYFTLFNKIKNNPALIFAKEKARLSLVKKIAICLKTKFMTKFFKRRCHYY